VEIVGRAPSRDEVPVAAAQRGGLDVVAAERRQPLPDGLASRVSVEDGVREAILGGDPFPGRATLVVLEPAVGIDELNAVHYLALVVAPRRRRRGPRVLREEDVRGQAEGKGR